MEQHPHQGFQDLLDRLLIDSGVSQEVVGFVLARTSLKAPAETTRIEIAEGNRAARRPVDQRDIPQATVSKAVKALQKEGLLENGETFILGKENRPLMPLRLGRGLAIAGVHVAQKGNRPTAVTTALVGLDSSFKHTKALKGDVLEGGDDSWLRAAELVLRQVTDLKEVLDKERANEGKVPVRLFGVGVEVGAPVHNGEIVPVLGGQKSVDFASKLRQLFQAANDDDFAVPVVVENDVNSLAVLAIHEAHYAERDLVVVSVFDEGIGGGLVMDGRLRRGGNGMAMEVGHLVIGYPPGGHSDELPARDQEDDPQATNGERSTERRPTFHDPCECGGTGHVDTLATPSRMAGQLGMSFEDAVRIKDGDDDFSDAHEVFTRGGRVLGRAIAHVCNIVNPSRLIVYLPAALAEPAEGSAAQAYYKAAEVEIRSAFAVAGNLASDRTAEDIERFLKPRPIPDDAALLGARAAAVCVLESFIEHALRLDGCNYSN